MGEPCHLFRSLASAALILFGSLLSMVHLPRTMHVALALNPMQQRNLIEKHYDLAAFLIMGTTFIVAVFYCLDALYGERRDRSILFWSLPVSDLTTVFKGKHSDCDFTAAHFRDHRCHAMDHAAA